MNNHPIGFGEDRDAWVPDDLRAIDAALSRMGEVDRASADDSLESRLFAGTRDLVVEAAGVAGVRGNVDALARRVREGAPLDLERRVFEATRGSLHGARRDRGGRVIVLRRRLARVAMAAAAVLAVVAGFSLYTGRSEPAGTMEPDSIDLAIMDFPKAATSLVLFDDLRSQVDRLDRSVHGEWITVEQGIDEEAL
ncbi:MAG: hypothetical protein KF745_10170 [Phycisphaeraceae bacterium]|nr:hypothetical protein [Phycisphaeraceae bacterium]